jgi:hypothetical protein
VREESWRVSLGQSKSSEERSSGLQEREGMQQLAER